MEGRVRGRRWLAPEVIQSSAMDCGPAALKCLLEGHGVGVSYGRLRELCQTDVDGTSIDTIEEVGRALGLVTEQVMVPADHVLVDTARVLPALAVVRQPNGATHFVAIWRRWGSLVQVMDPSVGRQWLAARRLLGSLYQHRAIVPASAWREWAGSDEFTAPLRARLDRLRIGRAASDRLIGKAAVDPGWQGLASLDAATRMLDSLVRSGGLSGGSQAARIVEALVAGDREQAMESAIPAHYRSVQDAGETAGEQQLAFRGAVLVRVRGRAHADRGAASAPQPSSRPAALAAAMAEDARPGRAFFGLLREGGGAPLAVVGAAAALAAAAVAAEALLFRALLDLPPWLAVAEQRWAGMVALLILGLGLVALEVPLLSALLRFGRHLEVRLRARWLTRIPRLGDRYFHSRLSSDLAERAHVLHTMRAAVDVAGRLVRATAGILFTALAIAWLDPASAALAAAVAILTIGLPFAFHPVLVERDMRVRSHAGALSRFYMESLLGGVAVRAHGAQTAVRREHESLLVEWARAALRRLDAFIGLQGAQFALGFGGALWIVAGHAARQPETGVALLLVYWTLKMPVLGQDLSMAYRQIPGLRNVLIRVLEPLGAPEQTAPESMTPTGGAGLVPATRAATGGVAIELTGVHVRSAGHAILEDVNLSVDAGEHVAIVGRSGAGKSSLVGLLLGWHVPARGSVRVDGVPVDARSLGLLREGTAWVDPGVQLWNRSLLENVRYGVADGGGERLWEATDAADLYDVLERLPRGWRTTLGEGGGLVSGGEGQRVRLARAALRENVRLAILDEPFRGLDGERRRALLARSRERWRTATLFFITHDLEATLSFDRVLVIEGGRIVEEGAPATLSESGGSAYRRLLDEGRAMRRDVWDATHWRRIRVAGGGVAEGPWTP